MQSTLFSQMPISSMLFMPGNKLKKNSEISLNFKFARERYFQLKIIKKYEKKENCIVGIIRILQLHTYISILFKRVMEMSGNALRTHIGGHFIGRLVGAGCVCVDVL